MVFTFIYCNFASANRISRDMHVSVQEIIDFLDKDIFRLISSVADEMGLECYVIGGFVRDFFLYRPSKDIDIVTLGRGIDLAEAVAKKMKGRPPVTVFKNFGTAQIKHRDYEVA